MTLFSLAPLVWCWITGAALEELGGGTIRIYAHNTLMMVRELTLLAFWYGTMVLMCQPKGKDYKNMFDRPPYVPWGMGLFCAAVEM